MQKNLRDVIIEKLATGTKPVGGLVQVVAAEHCVTIQGVYKALRGLRVDEVITVYNKQASLSLIWLDTKQRTLARMTKLYVQEQYLAESIAQKRTKLKFTFKTLRELDHFWVQSYTVLSESIPVTEVSYSIHPHDWYYYSELDSDAFWITKHKETTRPSRVVLTRATTLDLVVMRRRKNELGNLFAFTTGQNPLKQDIRTHYNVIGSYVFMAYFDNGVAEALDSFITNRQKLPLTTVDKKVLQEIIDREGSFTLTIERSDKRAQSLRQSVLKYFEF